MSVSIARYISVAAVIALGFLQGCAPQADPRFTTAIAEIGDVRDVVPAVGRIGALTEVEVRAEVDGRITDVFVDANAPVSRGQVLARIRTDRVSLKAEAAEAELAAASAAVSEANARLERAEQNLRNRRVLADRGFISINALNDVEGEASAARAASDRARAEQSRAQIELRAARSELEDILIRAPVDGFVLSRSVAVGEVVSRTSEEPLFVVVSDTDRVQIEALVAEPDIGRVNRNVRVRFTVDAYPTEDFSGQIRAILRDPQTERSMVSYPVIIDADNAENRLFPGMTAAVEFIHVDARRVLRIPISALYFKPREYRPRLSDEVMAELRRRGLTSPDALAGAELGTLFADYKQRIFILDNGQPAMRAVRVGAQSAEHVEITEGLVPGDLVITSEASDGGRS